MQIINFVKVVFWNILGIMHNKNFCCSVLPVEHDYNEDHLRNPFGTTKVIFSDQWEPNDFQNTTLHMVFKGGNMRKDILTNNRFVHCCGFFARVADGLVVENGLKIVKFISVIV